MSKHDARLTELIEKFFEQVEENKKNIEPANREENERNIIQRYNDIVRYTRPSWEVFNADQKAELKRRLLVIYNNLKESLNKLNSNVALPDNLATEIAYEPKQIPNTEKQEPNEEKEDLLKSKLEFDKGIFEALVDEFYSWDKKVTRKNASENPDKVSLRTEKIIESYNNIIDFSKPILEGNDEDVKKYITSQLQEIKENVLDDLSILNSDAVVPNELTGKILTKSNSTTTINDNSKKSTGDAHTENNKKEPATDNKQQNNDSDISKRTNNTKSKMADFAYITSISRIISYTYKGDPNGLNAFIAALELADAASTNEQQETLVKFIKTKLEGRALEAVPAEVKTAREIINALKQKIKPESSKIVVGRLLALRTERTGLQKFQESAEELTDQLRRAYISEGMTTELAQTTTIEKTVEMCRMSARTPLVKSVLASTNFTEPKEVLAKLITESTTEQSEQQQVLAFHGNRRFNNNNRNQHNRNYSNTMNRGSFRPRNGGYQNNYRSNGYQNDYRSSRGNFNNFRGRNNNYRGNNRPNNSNWRQNNSNRPQERRNVYYAENTGAPPSGAATEQVQQVQLRYAEDRRN